MANPDNDRQVIAILAKKNKLSEGNVRYDVNNNVIELHLSEQNLEEFPPELGQLTHLVILDLSNNQLTSIPSELSWLIRLMILKLNNNRLTSIPKELGQLTHLQNLLLDSNQLTSIPPMLSQLTSLQYLYINNNRLTSIPKELSQLTGLKILNLDNNPLTSIPKELGQLTDLGVLYLSNNQLTTIPKELGQLTHLRKICLSNNHLTTIPQELGQLTSLRYLYLDNNQLTAFSSKLGQLTNLHVLDLFNNQLTTIPSELGQLTNLERLELDNNPHLLTVPLEIVARGTEDILSFLRELQTNSVTRYEAKLLFVGEGGTGKSSLLRALRNQTFDPTLSTTHGIEVDTLQLPNQNQLSKKITLNTWDFGGQQIYHATHQFFLTERSLYLLIWNARLGAEQGRLHYWLETIKALAPEAPVLLVATHIDERAPNLNYQLYKDTYPQIIGHINVSNATDVGIAELRALLAQCAIKLPVMGQLQPEKWLRAEALLITRPEHHIDTAFYTQICRTSGVREELARGTFGNYLHDLGKILYFQDDYVLRNVVVLKPNWVTKAISRVLTDEGVRTMQGILLHADLPRIWATDEEGKAYPSDLYPAFLRLMERFYLSYQIETDAPGDYAKRSLIPQLLPYQPPANLAAWPITPVSGQIQIEMVYCFEFLPEGIMSWFIVRTHRYTQNQHWRDGVVLAYQDHAARVELNPMKRELRLLAWGVQPHNFFTILMHTVDTILARFEGLKVRREIPCICHWEQPAKEPCSHFYAYDELTRRMELKRYKIECPKSFIVVPVPLLLYGIHTSTDQQVMDKLQDGQQKIAALLQEMKKEDLQKLEKLEYELDQLSILARQQSELLIRNFTRLWNVEMRKIEANCPNTFILLPGSDTIFNPRNWVGKAYKLRLVCQHPSAPHPVGEAYALRKDAKWWATINPWLNRLIEFLKFAVPMGRAIESLYDINASDVKQLQATIGLVEQITSDLKDLPSMDEMKDMARHPQTGYDQQYVGSALRALQHYLQEVDPTQVWGGLRATLTPDGNILWLCGKHREQYEAKPLKLDIV